MNEPAMNPAAARPIEDMTYEQALQELEAVVSALEAGSHGLDQALALFERGQALARYCNNLLDQADLKVRQILGEDLVDFETGEQ